MTEFVTFRLKTYSNLTDDDIAHKKAKVTKKCVIKRMLKVNHFKDCLSNNKPILQSQQKFVSEAHCVYTEEINKIALNSNDYKRLQTFDRIATYPCGTNVLKYVKVRC